MTPVDIWSRRLRHSRPSFQPEATLPTGGLEFSKRPQDATRKSTPGRLNRRRRDHRKRPRWPEPAREHSGPWLGAAADRKCAGDPRRARAARVGPEAGGRQQEAEEAARGGVSGRPQQMAPAPWHARPGVGRQGELRQGKAGGSRPPVPAKPLTPKSTRNPIGQIAAFAQKRSDFIAASDGLQFKHPPDLPFGENLFWHSSRSKDCDFMVRGWYDEIKLYDFKRPTFAAETGHFTQLIWRDTRRVGCATAPSEGPNGGLYLTCNYEPAGNFLGEFEANVPPPAERRPPVAPATTSPSTTTTTTTTTTTAPARVVPADLRNVSGPTGGQQTGTALASGSPKPPSGGSEQPTTKPKRKKKGKKKNKKEKNKKKKKNNKKKSSTATNTTTNITTTSTSTARPTTGG